MTADESAALQRLLRLSLAARLLADEPIPVRLGVETLLGEAAAEIVDAVRVDQLVAEEVMRRFEKAIGERVRDPRERGELIAVVRDVLGGGRRDNPESLAAAALVIGVAVLGAAGAAAAAAPLVGLLAGAPVLAAAVEAAVGAFGRGRGNETVPA